MNTITRFRRLLERALFSACVIAALSARISHAQDAPASPRTQNPINEDVPVPLHIVHGKITDTGGEEATLSNVVNYLQKRDPTADILLPEDLSQIRIDDLQLRDAPSDLALEALSAASGDQFIVETHRSGIRAGNPLYTIKKNGPPGPSKEERTVEALNLTGYLSYVNLDVHNRHLMATSGQDAKADERAKELDEVLAKLKDIIIRTIDDQEKFSLKPNNSRRDITFYADADLLVVVGTPEELETVRKIVNALPGQNSGRWVDANGTTHMPLALPNNRAAATVHAGNAGPAAASSQP